MCAKTEAKDVIESYLKLSGNSISFLAQNSNIGRSTIDRLRTNSLKTTPTPETCRKLGYFTSKKSNIKEMADHFETHPKFRAMLLEGVPYDSLNPNITYVPDMEGILEEWNNFAVYTLCATFEEGATKDDFKEIVGNFADKAIKILLKNDIIVQSGINYISKVKNFKVPSELINKHLPKITEINTLNSKHITWKLNYWLCYGFSKEAALKAGKILNTAVLDVLNMRNDSTNHGDTPFNMVVSVNSFDIAEGNNHE